MMALFNLYLRIFALLLPITAVLVFPSIQGTTPGLLMALMSPFVVLVCGPRNAIGYFRDILWLGVVIGVLVVLSQFALVLGSHGPVNDLVLIQDGPLDPFRITLVTQGLYLFAGLFTFLFFKFFYTSKWDVYILQGGGFLAFVGVLEWVYFIKSGSDFGFLVNRSFRTEEGSLTQSVSLFGLRLLRLKSLTGEPSMYALSILPYFAFSIAKRRYNYALFFLITLFLSTSTSAMLGVFLFSLMYVNIYVRGRAKKALILVGFIILCGAYYFAFNDLVDQMIIEKVMAQNQSGQQRTTQLLSHYEFWLSSGLLVQLFGIGWGTVRSTDLLSTLLVNTGLVGTAAWLVLFLRPYSKIGKEMREELQIFIGVFSVLVVMLIAVPEYSYLTTWVFLGVLYHQISRRAILPLGAHVNGRDVALRGYG